MTQHLNILVNESTYLLFPHSMFFKGYLDFDLGDCHIDKGAIIGFQYGSYGYSPIQLFRFDPTMIQKPKK